MGESGGCVSSLASSLGLCLPRRPPPPGVLVCLSKEPLATTTGLPAGILHYRRSLRVPRGVFAANAGILRPKQPPLYDVGGDDA